VEGDCVDAVPTLHIISSRSLAPGMASLRMCVMGSAVLADYRVLMMLLHQVVSIRQLGCCRDRHELANRWCHFLESDIVVWKFRCAFVKCVRSCLCVFIILFTGNGRFGFHPAENR
jgi:hypothetical protein